MNKINNGNLFKGLLLSLWLLPAVAGATTFSGMYVFGDSLSDNGNLYSTTYAALGTGYPAAPYYNGRFSNGPVAAEDMANMLGVSGNFHDFAYGGATSGVGNYADGGTVSSSGVFGLPGLAGEIGGYTSTFGSADPNALYMVWAGPNDYVAGSTDYALAASNVASSIQSLYDTGARHFLVANMPDLSMTPDYFGSADAQSFAVGFNGLLATDLAGLDTAGAQLTQFDTFGLFNDVLADPSAYGFANVSDPCYTGSYLVANSGTVCSDPSQYLFWDGFHPTATGHQILANAMVTSVVPVPASALLMASGLVLLGVQLRRRAS
jgi:phospholipase/lecithinase/hemolysin